MLILMLMIGLEPCKEDASIGGSSLLLVPLVPHLALGTYRIETKMMQEIVCI